MAKGRDGDQAMGEGSQGRRREAVGRPESPWGDRGGAAGPGPTVDGGQKTRGGAAYLSGRTLGPALPGVGRRALPAGEVARRRPGGHGGGPQGQKRRPSQGRVGPRHAAPRRTDHGKRVVVGPGEAPRPFSQKEVEEMSCTASAVTARPYGVKLVCRTWEQPRSSYYAARQARGSRCVWPQPANGGRRPPSLTPNSWN